MSADVNVKLELLFRRISNLSKCKVSPFWQNFKQSNLENNVAPYCQVGDTCNSNWTQPQSGQAGGSIL